MTVPVQDFTWSKTPYRVAGCTAIASGAVGLVAIGFLIAYLVLRSANSDLWMSMNRLHDVSVIAQVILLVPVITTLYKRSCQLPPAMSNFRLIIGIAALFCTGLFLWFGIIKIMADVLYMVPQGIFGVWLLVFCLRQNNILARGHKWFGVVVGLGLALVGIFPLEYALFVSPIILSIPAPTPAEIEQVPINQANMIVHQILFIGSPMGVLTLPFWTLWLGRRLLRERDHERQLVDGALNNRTGQE